MRRFTMVVSVLAAGLTAAAMTGAPRADAASRRSLPGSAPEWVAGALAQGRVPSTATVEFQVYLAPNGGVDALAAEVAKVSDPTSSSYRKFLSASQYHARYDATSASVAQLTKWLNKEHLTVTGVESQHRYLAVKGTVGKTQSAFKTRIQRYLRNGKPVQANATALTVPVDIAPLVLTVVGLDTTPYLMKHQAAPPPDGTANARPCSTYYGQRPASKQADNTTPLPTFAGKVLPYAVCGYTGKQFRSAYENNLSAGLTGSGATVAIVDAYASPTIGRDITRYASNNGDASYVGGQFTQATLGSTRLGYLCDESGWYGEQTLDIEAVHAMAPRAKIRYYGARSCFNSDLVSALNKVVDENKAQIVSNSWGGTETGSSASQVALFQSAFRQGAMQGISFMFSSGDNGDEVANTGTKQTDYPASDPNVTAVGGTADAIGADGKFKFQTGWGTKRYDLSQSPSRWTGGSYLYGAGGGVSKRFARPSYQNGVVPAQFSSGRAVPDVGLTADPNTGMLIGQTQTFSNGVRYGEYRIGGTSLASPLFAGMTSLLVQHAGGRLGLLNPAIYQQARRGTFTDVKGSPADAGNVRPDFVNGVSASNGIRYTVRTFNQNASLLVAPGWDPVTGVGSPNARWITSIDGD